MAQAQKRITALIFASSLFLILGGCASTGDTEMDEEVTDTSVPESVAPSSSDDDSYTVSRGDHLWGISGRSRIYGNPYQWPLIYKANSDKIKDADLIYAGQIFTIDRGASRSEINAAIRHAKSRGAWSLGEVESSDRSYLRQ